MNMTTNLLLPHYTAYFDEGIVGNVVLISKLFHWLNLNRVFAFLVHAYRNISLLVEAIEGSIL